MDMKEMVCLLLFIGCTITVRSQNSQKESVEQACLDYLEGFYEGDTAKIIRCMKPTLYKSGYWRNKKTGVYDFDGLMTFQQAVAYARNVKLKSHFAKPDSPKKVEVFDIGNVIASAKVHAWWGVDYILLSKAGDHWMIEEVLWEGPPDLPTAGK